jgi:glycosyltransferase involved in cell wall biosynthesis
MQIVLFTHPGFQYSQSMPRYARLLAEGMQARGHQVDCWTAQPHFFRLPVPGFFKKWFGYLDQFVVFPFWVKQQIRKRDRDTLFVFTDQALGPWVPLVANRKHVIHCHDFLAQQSALGLIPENPVSRSGKIYQAYIRRGYRRGKNFISISEKTRQDLQNFLKEAPALSEIVYNGLNQAFEPADPETVRKELSQQLQLNLIQGYILHVGGNQFYKNRRGVLEIYEQWRKISRKVLPLILVGTEPTEYLQQLKKVSSFQEDIHFLNALDDQSLRKAYQGANVLLYPSLAEGFGWPIAEAMASGCPVITTCEAPMNEVGGHAAYYIEKRPSDIRQVQSWGETASRQLERILQLKPWKRAVLIQKGLNNAERFNTPKSLDRIEAIYQQIIKS